MSWGAALGLLGESVASLGSTVLSVADNPYIQGGLTLATGGAAAPWIAAYNEYGSSTLHSWVDPKTGAPVPAGTAGARPLTEQEKWRLSGGKEGSEWNPVDPNDPFGKAMAARAAQDSVLRGNFTRAAPSEPEPPAKKKSGGGAGVVVAVIGGVSLLGLGLAFARRRG